MTEGLVSLRRPEPGPSRQHETWSEIYPMARPVFYAVCTCSWDSDPTFDGFQMLRDRYDHLIATGTFKP